MQKFKKILVALGISVVLILVAGALFIMFGSYSDGYRVGQVQKMARKGLIFKTWEGELVQGFLENAPSADGTTGGVATRLWYFTVDDDPQVLEGIEKAIERNHNVKLFYKEKFTSLPWVGDTRHIVYKVEQVQ